MLENVYGLFTEKFKDDIKAWDHFIEFLAVDNQGGLIHQLCHKFEWLFDDNKSTNSLMRMYNPALLRSDYYDHLGDMYFEKIIGLKQSQGNDLPLSTENDADGLIKTSFENTIATKIILDQNAGTGRYLMTAHKINPNAMLFGVENDIRALRIAFTNFAIHGISGYLLHADTRIHNIDMDTDEGMFNWTFANKWYSHVDKLKTINCKMSNIATTLL